MATKGKTPKHPQAHKGIRNEARPNGKSWKKHPRTIGGKCSVHSDLKGRAERRAVQAIEKMIAKGDVEFIGQ